MNAKFASFAAVFAKDRLARQFVLDFYYKTHEGCRAQQWETAAWRHQCLNHVKPNACRRMETPLKIKSHKQKYILLCTMSAGHSEPQL